MNNCWLHKTPTSKNNSEEGAKKSKKLKEHAGWKDNNNYQKNLAIILSPTPEKLDFDNLTKQKQYWIKQAENLTQDNHKLLAQNSAKSDLITQLTETIPNLEKDVASWKSAWEIVIEQKKELDKKLLERDNRLAQLTQTVKVSKALLQHQIDYLKNLTTRLEKEQNKNKDNQDYQTHLRQDLINVAKERQELQESLTKLIAEEEKNKQLRDEEITDLRKELSWLEDKHKATQQEQEKTKQELTQEQGWWDKWIADDNLFFSTTQMVGFVHQKTGKHFTLRISSSDLRLDYNITNNVSLADAKQMVKAIAEWYKKAH
jgi:chromosome segregation ATPase